MLELRRRVGRGAIGLVAFIVTGCSAGLGSSAPPSTRSPAAPPAVPTAVPSTVPPASVPPTSVITVEPSDGDPSTPADVSDALAGMTVEDKVGQLFMTVVYGSHAGSSSKENQARYGVATPAEVVAKYRPGGVILFPWAGNVSSATQVAALTTGLRKASSKTPLLIGVDQENGLVSRLRPLVTELPGSMAIGSTGDPGNARDAARVTGEELRDLGVSLDYAPVADVNINPRNPVIGPRAYGSDPREVAAMVGAAVDGFHAAGVASVAKHFPGHGDTSVDSHTGLPVIRHSMAQWEKLDAPPFRAAIAQGVDAIMSAHVVMPKLDPSGDPSTLSRKILTGLLREKLGFDGVITTDALDMAGVRKKYGDAEVAVRAILAGADMLLMPPDFRTAYGAVLKAVQTGRISEERLNESVTRILHLKESRGVFEATHTDPGALKSSEHLKVARRIRAAAAARAQSLPMRAL
ncbi:glycoside hydrolase family 3 protein [Planotetraspora sp. A-T 1434]|uniref:glycoside hydrolase family 3 protein n=1 Tax=Planotetraspora sp. A-T 1434 TaxID=2979219 RepID=UPI0021BF601D|nr:glycoside hydrolase family 3 protein [Planotetraspora sp. A-T 1434]MCT9928868.1 glycoside hydrolase family 3 protein [Planotetraspora sp. A-T 1434]